MPRHIPRFSQDSIIKVKSETYLLERWNHTGRCGIMRNVKNRIDTLRSEYEEPKFTFENKRKHLNVLGEVFSKERADELADLNAGFAAKVFCDSLGNVKECVFHLHEWALPISMEEIAAFEKALKRYKVVLLTKMPGVNRYEIMFLFKFKVWKQIREGGVCQ